MSDVPHPYRPSMRHHTGRASVPVPGAAGLVDETAPDGRVEPDDATAVYPAVTDVTDAPGDERNDVPEAVDATDTDDETDAEAADDPEAATDDETVTDADGSGNRADAEPGSVTGAEPQAPTGTEAAEPEAAPDAEVAAGSDAEAAGTDSGAESVAAGGDAGDVAGPGDAVDGGADHMDEDADTEPQAEIDATGEAGGSSDPANGTGVENAPDPAPAVPAADIVPAPATTTEPKVARSGATTVADEVVEKVAVIAARKVAGVHALGTGAARLLGPGGDSEKGLAVRIDGRTATIAVTVVVEYGHRVYDVANQLRDEVAEAVEAMVGIDVVAVDIVVEDVHLPE